MLCTIMMGNYISVQGTFVRNGTGNRIVVRVGDKLFEGTPVAQAA